MMSKILLFNRWDTENISIDDPGLRNYINLKPVIVPKTHGRHGNKQFHKSRISIVERLMNHLYVPGHRGRKHLVGSGMCSGKSYTAWKIIKETFEIIEKRIKKNPIEVLVKAIENSALREEITSFQVGGIIARKAVITAPQRRIDLAMRLITQTAYKRSRGSGKSMAQCLADELLGAFDNDSNKSVAIKEKERIEREAAGAR